MIQNQIELLRLFEEKYSKDDSKKIVTCLNNFIMLTVDDVTTRFRNDLTKMELSIESKIAKSEKELAMIYSKTTTTLVTAIGVATAVISLVLILLLR